MDSDSSSCETVLPRYESLQSNESTWISLGELFVNTFFLQRGIVLISSDPNPIQVSEEKSFFRVNEREFVFYQIQSNNEGKKPNNRALKKVLSIADKLSKFTTDSKNNDIVIASNLSGIFNQKRREEIFLPLLFKKEVSLGLYVYPWIAKNTDFSFSGFTQFVTAGCMFGANLRGITQHDDNVELIDHHLSLRSGQKIERIWHNTKTGNPYEEALFTEFEKNCSIISAFSKTGKPKRLLYHLPSLDYLLFGAKLYSQNLMTKEAFGQYINEVLAKESEYLARIKTLCQAHEIEVSIESPFADVFATLDRNYPVESVFNCLNLTVDTKERTLVARCIDLLLDKNTSSYQSLWADSLRTEISPPDDIESLFKLANAVMLAKAVQGAHPYEVCSMLPLSEKQIQVQYQLFSEQFSALFPEEATRYPALFNLTTFEPIIGYFQNNNNLLFYFPHHLKALSKLITEQKLTWKAARNIGFFCRDKENAILDKPDPVYTFGLD